VIALLYFFNHAACKWQQKKFDVHRNATSHTKTACDCYITQGVLTALCGAVLCNYSQM